MNSSTDVDNDWLVCVEDVDWLADVEEDPPTDVDNDWLVCVKDVDWLEEVVGWFSVDWLGVAVVVVSCTVEYIVPSC